ncbi:MAG TPA: Calx-beta domain-containing protein [Leptospiraceae bacterium]|nr:Calx-beta domain-containing protein [Leptospiraceae bacterium]
MSGNKKSGMIPLLPIGGSSPANGSQTTTTPETPPTAGNTSTTTPSIQFGSSSSTNLETSPSVTIPVTISVGSTATVDYTVSGTATGGGVDYTLANGSLTFSSATTTQNISFPIVNDALQEANETIIITLSNPSSGAVLGSITTHTYTIVDDDTPSIAFNATTSNGSEATTSVSIPVSISMTATASVNYSVTGGTATGSGTDFTLASGVLNFTNGGATSQNINFTVNNDTLYENNETIIITLASTTNANLGIDTVHTYTINDNDPVPTLGFSVTSSSGAESATSPTLNVTLSTASGLTTNVDYSVTGGTATGGGVDFTLNTGTLVFNPGTTTLSLPLSIINDTNTELNETLIVTLSNPTNANLNANTVHTYTVLDNDPPTVAFNTNSSSGSESTTAVSLPVSLSAVYASTVTVNYAVTGGTATGSGTDFTLASGTLTFTSGTLTQNINMTVVNDLLGESDETVIVTLSAPSNATLGTFTSHTYTINDNDPTTVEFSSSSSNGSEGTTAVTIPVTLSNSNASTVTVDYSVTGGTATGGGTDFTLASGTLTYTSGVTSQNISITINNDILLESNETIKISLANPTIATLGTNTEHTYTIIDNDTPSVGFSASTSSGAESVTTVNIPVALSIVSGSTVTVDYAVTGGTATGSGTDYTLASGTLTFNSGVTSQNISIAVNNDTLNELNETIIISISNPTVANLGAITSHTYTITDNDPIPSLSINNVSVTEGNAGTVNADFTVTLSAASGRSVTVDYSTSNGTASAGSDYTAIPTTTLTFNPGETTKTISVAVNGDSTDEVNETFNVSLANVSTSATIAVATGVGTITNDDTSPTLSIDNVSVTEGNASTVNATFTVSLSVASGKTITVDYVTANNTASSGSDYTAITTTTLTFNPGDTTKTFNVVVAGDTLDETDETFYVNLSNVNANATIATSQGIGTIVNDDMPPTVQFSASTSNSVNETQTNRTITLSLSAASGKTVSVVVTDLGTGTATAGSDYTNIGSPLTVNFTPGSTTANVTIAVLSDLLFEGNDTIDLSISSPTNASLGTQTTHTFTIIDDEIGVTSAETMDCDNNGKIDHYKLTFNTLVTDSTFPGYVLNSVGSVTTHWLVAGYSNVKLQHGTSVASVCSGFSDTANDAVLYLAFTEGVGFDTGAKPDLTTSSTPTLTGPTGTAAQLYTATVTESDRAKPVVVSASGNAGETGLTVTFSEAVYGTNGAPSCGSGGDLSATTLTYANSNAGGATSLSSMGADTCATSDSNAIFTANANFIAGDGDTSAPDDSVAGNSNLYDAANNTGNTTAKAISISAGNPTISLIEEYDTNGNGKIDQIKVVFSLSMNDATIDDLDASRFTMGGTAAIKVDTATSGTGTIVTPNTDTGVADDNTITLFTDDNTVSGTAVKAMAFTTSAGRWRSITGVELQTISNLTAVTVDKAPPVILTAVASPTGNTNATVDSGDTLVITFSEPTDKSITISNIASVLSLSSSHVWGDLTSANWNGAGDILTLTFAGTGSPTVAVGDYITIVNTLKDTASSPNTSTNKVSVTPISGSFGVDSTSPYLVYTSDITTNSLIVQFSEAMRMGSGTANQNADSLANYTLIEDPTNAGCADATLASLSVLSPTSVKINLSGGQSFCNIQYRLTVASTVTDLAGNAMGSPKFLTFIGLEKIKVVAATALTPNTIKITFSKPPLTGMNTTNSAECNSAYECGLRYKISPTIGDGTISSAVVGSGASNFTVTLTHNGSQAGVAYTVIVANATDNDNFNNGSVCIRDSAGTNCIQSAPNDRATFIGAGTACTTLACGSFFEDPFFDGTTFSFAFKYDGKVYLGTNDKNNAAFRFDPNGTNAILTSFAFVNNSSVSLSCAAATGFGYITTDLSTQTCGTNGGANGEVGAVGFNSINLTISSTNYELLGIGALKNNVDTVYYSQDKDILLDMKSFTITGTNGINSKSAQTLYGNADKVFNGISSDHGTNAPVLNRLPATAASGVVTIGTPVDLSGKNITVLGKAPAAGEPTNPNSSGVVGIDVIFTQGASTYLANNGGVIYVTTSKILSATPGNANDWKLGTTTFDPVLSTPSAATGTSLYMPASNSTTGGGLGKVRPGEKAYPYIILYNGKLYMVRNVGDTTPTTNLRGEVWTCTPNASGQCAPAGWSKIISGTETDIGSTATAIGMLIANGNNLYLGFDDPVSGVRVFKFSGTTPSATSGTMSGAGWVQQGTNGLGSNSKYIMTSVSLYDQITNKNYIYIAIGNGLGTTAIKVVRQVD